MATEKSSSTFTPTELRGAFIDLGLGHVGVNAGHPSYGLVGNGTADDTTAIQAAVTAARAANLPLILPPEKTIKYTDAIVADWDHPSIIGFGNSILKPTAAAGTGIYIGGASGPVRQAVFSGFIIEGTGDFGDAQTLIECHATGGKMITLENLIVRYGQVGLYTQLTDYLQMRRVWFRGSETNWHAGQNTNASTLIACPMGGLAADGTTSVTSKHIHCDGIAGLEIIGSEFGDGDYGLYAASGGNDNRCIALRGHRTERVRVHDVVWGTGTSGPPAFLTLDNCEFVAEAAESARSLIVNDGGLALGMRNCWAIQTSASHVLVEAQDVTSEVHIEDSRIYLGDLFKDSVGGIENSREILHGW